MFSKSSSTFQVEWDNSCSTLPQTIDLNFSNKSDIVPDGIIEEFPLYNYIMPIFYLKLRKIIPRANFQIEDNSNSSI